MPEAVSPHAVAAIRLLILAGCRKREILHLRREQVDLEAPEPILLDSKTGPRKVSFSPRAVVVLKIIEQVPSKIPGRVEGRPMRNIDEAWRGCSASSSASRTPASTTADTVLRPVRSLWARISR